MHTPFKTLRTKRRRGASVVEAAMVLPIVLLFLLGILEYGRYVMMMQVLTNSAREGAHYALTHTEPFTLQGTTYGNATSDVQAIVAKYSAGQQLAGQTVEVYESDIAGNNTGAWTNAASGETICVKISGTYHFMIPEMLKLPSTIPISVQSIMRSEGN
jgi:Flp pilus assembly protein TadG